MYWFNSSILCCVLYKFPTRSETKVSLVNLIHRKIDRFREIAEHSVSSPEFIPLTTQKDVYEMRDIFDQGFIPEKNFEVS